MVSFSWIWTAIKSQRRMIYGKGQFAENFWETFGVRRQSEAATALWMHLSVVDERGLEISKAVSPDTSGLPPHSTLDSYSSSARNFSSTEKSSRVVVSPATLPLVASSRNR